MSFQTLKECTYSAVNRAYDFWSTTCQPGERQNKAQACVRTVVGLASIHLYFPASVTGAIVGSVKPEYTKTVCSTIDGMITGFWNKLSYNQKVAASIAGVSLAYVGMGYMYIPGSIFALKLSAELAYKNAGKEEIASKVRELEEQQKVE